MDSYPIVEVVWLDAEEHGEVGWNDTAKMLEYAKLPCSTMRSVGYLVYEGDDHISLIRTLNEDNCGTIEKIPKAFVQSLRKLRVSKK